MTTTSTVLQYWPAGDGWWQCMTMFLCSTWKTQKIKKQKCSAVPPVSYVWCWPKRGIYILKKKHVCFLRFVQCVYCCRPSAAACFCCRWCSFAVMSRTCQLEIKKKTFDYFSKYFPQENKLLTPVLFPAQTRATSRSPLGVTFQQIRESLYEVCEVLLEPLPVVNGWRQGDTVDQWPLD